MNIHGRPSFFIRDGLMKGSLTQLALPLFPRAGYEIPSLSLAGCISYLLMPAREMKYQIDAQLIH